MAFSFDQTIAGDDDFAHDKTCLALRICRACRSLLITPLY